MVFDIEESETAASCGGLKHDNEAQGGATAREDEGREAFDVEVDDAAAFCDGSAGGEDVHAGAAEAQAGSNEASGEFCKELAGPMLHPGKVAFDNFVGCDGAAKVDVGL